MVLLYLLWWEKIKQENGFLIYNKPNYIFYLFKFNFLKVTSYIYTTQVQVPLIKIGCNYTSKVKLTIQHFTKQQKNIIRRQLNTINLSLVFLSLFSWLMVRNSSFSLRHDYQSDSGINKVYMNWIEKRSWIFHKVEEHSEVQDYERKAAPLNRSL